MSETAAHSARYPRIEPLPEGVARPFWSVMIPTYNRSTYLHQALASVLAQDPGAEAMQIEVVDHSTDAGDRTNVERIVAEVGKGRVALSRPGAHSNIGGDWTASVRLARGEWVHLLHEDDRVLNGFYATLEPALRENDAVGFATCRCLIGDGSAQDLLIAPNMRETPGVVEDFLARIAQLQLLWTPAVVVRRAAYERVGGFDPELYFCVDWDMWKRLALQYSFWYDPSPLAIYRMHEASTSMSLFRAAATISDTSHAIALAREYLPTGLGENVEYSAQDYLAYSSVAALRITMARGDLKGLAATVLETLKARPSPQTLLLLGRFLAHKGWSYLRATRRPRRL